MGSNAETRRSGVEGGAMNHLALASLISSALVAAAGIRAQTRFFEFFVPNIHDPHTRRLSDIIGEMRS